MDTTALHVAGTVFNAAGFTAAWFAIDAIVTRRTPRLAWLLPALLLAAWLAVAFHASVAPPASLGGALAAGAPRIALAVSGFVIAAFLVYTALRRPWGRRPAHGPSAAIAEPAITWDHDSDRAAPGLRHTLALFLGAADVGDVATAAAIYDPSFACVRVADAGGFVRLSREQMLAFWRKAVADAERAAASGGGTAVATHSAIVTRRTVVHGVDRAGDDAFVLLTREKDLGAGFEPLFYVLAWRHVDGAWKLRREFVHQRSAPNFG